MFQYGVWHIVCPTGNVHVFTVAVQYNVSDRDKEPTGQDFAIFRKLLIDDHVAGPLGHFMQINHTITLVLRLDAEHFLGYVLLVPPAGLHICHIVIWIDRGGLFKQRHDRIVLNVDLQAVCKPVPEIEKS